MLNVKQKKAAFEMVGNTLLNASPGSGKTRTLIARAENKLESLPDKETLALITYTNAASDEIAARLVTQTPVFIGTIHRFCLEFILRPFSWVYSWPRPRVVSYEELKQFIESNKDFDLGDYPLDVINKIRKNHDGALETNVEWDYESQLTEVAEKYYDYLESLDSLDFNEILFRSYKLVSENDFIAKSLANKFYEILIDEFQDTNTFQYKIFNLIDSHKKCTFFMVGDQRQQIYRFAGAMRDAFTAAKDEFSADDDVLHEVYRSTNKIVKAYCSLFPDHPELTNSSPYKDLDADVEFLEFDKASHDGGLKGCVRMLREDLDLPETEIAVLSARWTDSYNAGRILRRDYNVVGFGALPHPMRNLNNSTFNLLRSLSRFTCKASVKNLRAIKRAIELHALENDLHLDDREIVGMQNSVIYKFQVSNIQAPIVDGINNVNTIFSEVFGIKHTSFDDIIEAIDAEEIPYWDFEKYIKALSGVDGITLNTIHQSKGLEYDAVILDQMNENKIPFQKLISRAGWVYEELSEESKEDGRNLFYVAMSRARKYLIILHNWKPSIFVNLVKSSNP